MLVKNISYFLNILLILLILLTINSCAFINSEVVPVYIHTVPGEADIYIGNEKYHKKTSTIIDIKPEKDYDIYIRKAGYRDAHFSLKKKSGFRGKLKNYRKSIQNKRCLMDKILIIPFLIGKMSSNYDIHCSGFENNSYSINLTKIKSSKRRQRKRLSPKDLGLFPHEIYSKPPQYYYDHNRNARDPQYNRDLKRRYGW